MPSMIAFSAALGRMARELAAVNEVSETEAVQLIELNLNKGPKRVAKGEEEAEAEGEADAPAAASGETDEQEKAA